MHSRSVKRLRRAGWLALPVAALLAQTSCSPEPPGRCGAYTVTPGTARITTVETAPAGELSCRNDPVRVLFDFTPTDPVSAGAATGVRLQIGSGENPPRAWVSAEGLVVGSDHPATRSDQPVGPCSPVVWALTDVDVSAALAACN